MLSILVVGIEAAVKATDFWDVGKKTHSAVSRWQKFSVISPCRKILSFSSHRFPSFFTTTQFSHRRLNATKDVSLNKYCMLSGIPSFFNPSSYRHRFVVVRTRWSWNCLSLSCYIAVDDDFLRLLLFFSVFSFPPFKMQWFKRKFVTTVIFWDM